jgi:hypothetical protein
MIRFAARSQVPPTARGLQEASLHYDASTLTQTPNPAKDSIYRHLLVAVQRTGICIEAISLATQFAQAIGARITFRRLLTACERSDSQVNSAGQFAALAWPVAEGSGDLRARAETGARTGLRVMLDRCTPKE